MKNIKAFKVSCPDYENSIIVFAESHNQAKSAVANELVVGGYEYHQLRCKRLPEADQYATDTLSVMWWDSPRSHRIYYDLGWRSYEEPSCDRCGAGEFESIPESIVEGQEDGGEVCRKCLEEDRRREKERA